MREAIAVLRGYRLAALLAAVTVAGALSSCGGSDSAQSAPGLSCTNYALHGTGKYHDEVSVSVKVSNSTTHLARYAIDVALTASHDGPGDAPSTHVIIHGSVASHASTELSRKVLTADPVQRCRVTRTTRLSGS
jgi:hypothetical protein